MARLSPPVTMCADIDIFFQGFYYIFICLVRALWGFLDVVPIF